MERSGGLVPRLGISISSTCGQDDAMACSCSQVLIDFNVLLIVYIPLMTVSVSAEESKTAREREIRRHAIDIRFTLITHRQPHVNAAF